MALFFVCDVCLELVAPKFPFACISILFKYLRVRISVPLAAMQCRNHYLLLRLSDWLDLIFAYPFYR